jgi:hypothetical protein
MIEGKQDFSKLFGDKGIEAKSPERTRKGEENFQHQDIYKFRKEKYDLLYWTICAYVFLIFITVWGNKNYFQLENSILITLLSTTTANILGLFYIASKWLFPNKE